MGSTVGRTMQKARYRMQRTPWNLSITWLTVWLLLLYAGCAGVRPARPPAELLAQRQTHDAQMAATVRAFGQRMLERLKARYDARPGEPLMYDILVLSGGGDWGAFGADVLKGWSRVHGPLARPEFDVVTGVSTGALIAPFAFLGDAPSLDTIVDLYRNPRRDLVKQRWPLYFLPANESFATMCHSMPPAPS